VSERSLTTFHSIQVTYPNIHESTKPLAGKPAGAPEVGHRLEQRVHDVRLDTEHLLKPECVESHMPTVEDTLGKWVFTVRDEPDHLKAIVYIQSIAPQHLRLTVLQIRRLNEIIRDAFESPKFDGGLLSGKVGAYLSTCQEQNNMPLLQRSFTQGSLGATYLDDMRERESGIRSVAGRAGRIWHANTSIMEKIEQQVAIAKHIDVRHFNRPLTAEQQRSASSLIAISLENQKRNRETYKDGEWETRFAEQTQREAAGIIVKLTALREAISTNIDRGVFTQSDGQALLADIDRMQSKSPDERTTDDEIAWIQLHRALYAVEQVYVNGGVPRKPDQSFGAEPAMRHAHHAHVDAMNLINRLVGRPLVDHDSVKMRGED